MGDWALGMGHWEWGIGNGASAKEGIGHWRHSLEGDW